MYRHGSVSFRAFIMHRGHYLPQKSTNSSLYSAPCVPFVARRDLWCACDSLAGVIVVTAAGNGGDTHYIMSSPASSTRAIAVANIVDWGVQNALLPVNSPAAI